MKHLVTGSILGLSLLAASGHAATGLSGDTWVAHYNQDIKPWYLDAGAQGVPAGNFPSYRQLTGVEARSPRFVRMLGRQTYTYAMGFNLTGDDRLLRLAFAGMNWQLDHARHDGGGFYPLLDEQGRTIPGYPLSAQDQAYSQVGLAAIYAVTRDARAKAELDAMRHLILRGIYWDADKGTVKDAFTDNYGDESGFEAPGNDLVSVLDQINSYLLLYQNQNPDGQEKLAQLDELKLLADRVVDGFWADGVFWNTDENRSDYGASHVDVGHTVKAYWLLNEIGRKWARIHGHDPYRWLVQRYGQAVLGAAFNSETNAWNQRFDEDYRVTHGSDPAWWIFCEADQFAGRLAMENPAWLYVLKRTTDFWLDGNFIDRGRPQRGIREGIRGDGSLYGDNDVWESKQNNWKNGYHETEHALMMYLTMQARRGLPVTLYFAVTPAQLATFAPQPYYFEADVTSQEVVSDVNDLGLVKVKVEFTNLR